MVQMYKNWAENDKHIENVNFQNLTYALGHNQFSGMSTEDFREYLGYSKLFGETSNLRGVLSFETVGAGDLTSLPKSIDWVELGAVTSVKDQGQCGSCWSFSTTGALEGAYYLANGQLISFSEQQLVDCDNWKNGGRDHGCNGGLMDNAFNWIGKNSGLCTETGYPYVSGTTKTAGDCTTSCSKVSGSSIASFVDVEPSSDDAMMTAVAKQPVSVAIEADQKDFQFYKSGVFTSSCGTNLDHGVLVVGYGTMDGQDYYKVKNSWASTWGADGYIYLGRGSSYNNGDGQCGVLLEASYPVL
jgi:C1A family cysteine protease